MIRPGIDTAVLLKTMRKTPKVMSKITDNLLSWDVVNKAPHYVWETYNGRSVMEKRLGQLIEAGEKFWDEGKHREFHGNEGSDEI